MFLKYFNLIFIFSKQNPDSQESEKELNFKKFKIRIARGIRVIIIIINIDKSLYWIFVEINMFSIGVTCEESKSGKNVADTISWLLAKSHVIVVNFFLILNLILYTPLLLNLYTNCRSIEEVLLTWVIFPSIYTSISFISKLF